MNDKPTITDVYQVTGQKSAKSIYGKQYTQVFLKNVTRGGSYSTYLYPDYGNFQRWQGKTKRGTCLTGLFLKNGGYRMIDADSMPKVVQPPKEPEAPKPVAPEEPKQEKLIDVPPAKPRHFDMG